VARTLNRDTHLEEGMPVITMDGQPLGTIKEIRDDAIKVDARFARDYWLSRDEVVVNEDARAMVLVTKDVINAYKLSRPGAAASEAPTPDAVRDHYERDQLLRR
jgi:hypothetical protein